MKSPTLSPISCSSMRVSIIGAGKVGSTLAQRMAEKSIADIVLMDILPGMPQAIALDLMEARGIEDHGREIIGTNDYKDTAQSQIVVITAGKPRTPGMSRDDLLKINAKIVVEAAKNAIAHSPDAIFIIVTNPLDVMTYLAWEATGLAPQQVMGMAGILDSSRFESFIAMELGCPTRDVHAIVLGSHGDLMVPIPRLATVRGIPVTELLDTETINRLVERTRHGGAEIVELMKTGGAYFAPASSIGLMIEAILHNQSRFLPVASYLQGEYGLKDLFIGVPSRLGCRGIEGILELPLTDSEYQALHHCAESVQHNIQLAQELLYSS